MIPILYDSNETNFTTNGIGGLPDAVYCAVSETRNGEYELEMEYPVTGLHYSDIEMLRLVYAQPADGKSPQPFEIYSISKPLNGIVTIYARHISYRLNKIVVNPFSAGSCAAAMSGLKTYSVGTNPFTFWTDKAVSATFTVETPAQIRGLLGGQQGSILDVYGKGEYEWDKFTVRLHLNRGAYNGVTIRYGKNLTALNADGDTQSVYTGIVPYYYENGVLVTLPEKIVYGDHRGDYPYDMVVPVDLSDKFSDAVPTVAELRTKAQAYMAASEGWRINTNIKVSFVNLADTEEYKDVAALQRVNLCDTVTVLHEGLGVSATAQVVKTVYNVLLERYDSIELGATSTSLGQAITESIMEEVPTYSFMEQAIANGTSLITGNQGGYVVLKSNANGKPEEILLMDTDDIETATKVWRFNSSGIGYSQNGYNGTYKQAWTIDGQFYTDWVTAGSIKAGLVNTGVLKSLNSAVVFDLDNGTLTMGNRALVITAGNLQIDANGNVTITGTVTANAGKIGGWDISSTLLDKYTGTSGTVYRAFLYAPPSPTGTNRAFAIEQGTFTGGTYSETTRLFHVRYDGYLYAAGGGKIGAWTLQSLANGGALYNGMTSLTDTTHNGVYIGANGIALGKGAFKVTNTGTLTSTDANITGIFQNETKGSGTSGRWRRCQISDNKVSFWYGGTGTSPSWDSQYAGAIDFIDEQIFSIPSSIRSNYGMRSDFKNIQFDNATLETGGASIGVLQVNGTPITENSDRNIKKDIEYLTDEKCFADVMKLKPVSYKFDESYFADSRKHHGFIAQDVEKENLDWDFVYAGNDGTLALQYGNLVADLVGAVKHLSKRVEELEEKLNDNTNNVS